MPEERPHRIRKLPSAGTSEPNLARRKTSPAPITRRCRLLHRFDVLLRKLCAAETWFGTSHSRRQRVWSTATDRHMASRKSVMLLPPRIRQNGCAVFGIPSRVPGHFALPPFGSVCVCALPGPSAPARRIAKVRAGRPGQVQNLLLKMHISPHAGRCPLMGFQFGFSLWLCWFARLD
jgi:hypothetical protein